MRVDASARGLAGNALANYAYIGVMAAVTLVVLPLYVRRLGAQAWGDVAVCLALQGALFALDFLLSPPMLRDVARATATGDLAAVQRRYQRWYLVSAAVLVALGALALGLAQAAARLPDGDLAMALRLALVQCLFQFANNAAIGFWNGQGRQALANTRLAGFALAKHAAALVLLYRWEPSATLYMLPFASIAAVEFAANAWRVRRELGGRSGAAPVAPTPSPVPAAPRGHADAGMARRDAAGYALAAALGLAGSQCDRLWLAAALPAAEYGHYALASGLMLSLFSLQMPLQRAFLPRLAIAAAPRAVAAQLRRWMLALLVLPCLVAAMVPEWLLRLWLRDAALAATVAPLLRWLLVAVALNALYAPSALLLLARHRNAALATINAGALLLQIGTLAWATPRVGALAGGAAWLACAVWQGGAAWWQIRRRPDG
jgi:O-antigen/teichoic acid export membrane protein